MAKKPPKRKPQEAHKAAHYDPFLSLYEAADYTGYHWQTVRKAIMEKELRSCRGPGLRSSHKIRLSELNRWMASREGKLSRVKF